jgi:ApaG protein
MNAPSHELPGLRVSVDRVVYQTDPGFPADRPHAFIYFLTITNGSSRAVTLLGRKWIIREGGETLVVEGDGIVGEKPALSPGESFSYNSYHLATGDSDAHGAFHGVDADGNAIFTRIPEFQMRVPAKL